MRRRPFASSVGASIKEPADGRGNGYGEAVAGVKSSRETRCELLEGQGFGAERDKMQAAKAGGRVARARRPGAARSP